jgi:hypothetical protein
MQLGSELLRGDLRQRQLWRLKNGQFVFHTWDYDDPTTGRSASLTTPHEAAEWLVS